MTSRRPSGRCWRWAPGGCPATSPASGSTPIRPATRSASAGSSRSWSAPQPAQHVPLPPDLRADLVSDALRRGVRVLRTEQQLAKTVPGKPGDLRPHLAELAAGDLDGSFQLRRLAGRVRRIRGFHLPFPGQLRQPRTVVGGIGGVDAGGELLPAPPVGVAGGKVGMAELDQGPEQRTDLV